MDLKTLDDDKFILDATAGFRMMWFDKNNKNTIYLDKRNDAEILRDIDQFGINRGRPIFKDWKPKNPTLQGDFRKTEFPDKTFKMIVWDPPHLKGSGSRKHQQGLCFGVLQAETWQSDFKRGFEELWRILDDYGVLFFKWHDSQFDYKKVLKLFPKKPLLGQITSNHKSPDGKKKRLTFWFCFMKIPEQATPEHKQGFVVAPGQLLLTISTEQRGEKP